MSAADDTHEVFNQSPPFAGRNLFTSDPGLGAIVEGLPQDVQEQLAAHGAAWGSADVFELGRIANQSPPVLKTHGLSDGARLRVSYYHAITVGSDNTIRSYNPQPPNPQPAMPPSQDPAQTMAGHTAAINSILFAPDNRTALTASAAE